MKHKLLLLIFTIIIYTSSIPQAFAAEQNYYTAASEKDIENVIYSAIENRISSFQIKYTGNTENIMSDVKTARDAAVKRDPYEEGCISLISGFKVSKFTDYADISFDGFTYYTTLDQEKYVDTEIKSIVAQIITTQMSDSQKEKAIHDYIVNHTEYDLSLQGYTAYSALHDGKTVCNGYVQTAYLMFKEAGMESMIVKGTYISNGQATDHEWNLVKINGSWYHLDITLDDAASDTSAISYANYNLSDIQIKVNHNFDTTSYPAASSESPVDTAPTTPTIPTTPPISSSGSTPVANANSDITEINKYKDIEQPTNKTWKIKFNKEINDSTIDSKSISVYDSNDNLVSDIKVSLDITGNEVVISAPYDGYKSGQSYYILISKDIKSSSGSGFEKAIKIPFKIK